MPAPPDPFHDEVTERLRAADQRYTSGRRRLVEMLRTATAPVTIPQILAATPGLAQSSVYRNLAVLEEVGVATRIVTRDDFARYELAEGLTDHHHHHLICSSCGEVSDFALQPGVEEELERALAAVARDVDFTVDGHRLDLLGTCPGCR